jgi:hypothetical protein
MLWQILDEHVKHAGAGAGNRANADPLLVVA